MKIYRIVPFLILLLNVSFSHAKKPLTFLVYIAADNNLYQFIEDDLGEMQRIGSENEYINILVYLNTRRPGENKVSQKLLVHQGYVEQYGKDKCYDSGSEETLFRACKWAAKHFPSDHFALVLWDHGSGSLNRVLGDTITQDTWLARSINNNRSVCYDDTTGNYLTDIKLHHALGRFCRECRQGRMIDIVAFDACLMSCIEVAYAVSPFAQFMVASQQTIPGEGYGYDYALTRAAQGETDPYTLVQTMVSAYDNEYNNITGDYTLAAIDLGNLKSLIHSVDLVSHILKKFLRGPDRQSMHDAIKLSADGKSCTRFDEPNYMDLGHFYANLKKNLQVLNLRNKTLKSSLDFVLQIGIDAINKAVLAKVQGGLFPRATGLSIYFDLNHIDDTYPELLWSRKSKWYSFLREFMK
jgi:hypothetical protein